MSEYERTVEPISQDAATIGQTAHAIISRLTEECEALRRAQRSRLSDFTDAEIAADFDRRARERLGDPWKGVSFPSTSRCSPATEGGGT